MDDSLDGFVISILEVNLLLVGLIRLIPKLLIDHLALCFIGSSDNLSLCIVIDDIGNWVKESVLEVEGLLWDLLQSFL